MKRWTVSCPKFVTQIVRRAIKIFEILIRFMNYEKKKEKKEKESKNSTDAIWKHVTSYE